AFPCFKLSSILKKNPVEIAKQLQKEIKITDSLEKVQATGPYLNFFVNKTQEAEFILKITDQYGNSKQGKDKKIVIDFSGPNIGKPMHVGHIRSTVVGDSILRNYNALGYKTIGINYLGDIGLHIGKLIVAWELWLDKKALEKDPIKELLRLYVKFCENEKSEFQEGQDEEFEANEWTNKAKEKLKLIELGDKKTHEVWKQIRVYSGKGFDKVYKILNIDFTETTGQSKFSEAGKEIIINAQKKGLAKTEQDGAVMVEFDKLPKRYILRSNGTASYITQDIGAAIERQKKYQFDKMIYVTDYRQQLHFQQLFEILNKFGFKFYNKCYHVPFGTVNFGKEIMATRAGKIILLEDVLKKTIEKAEEEIKKRKTKGDAEKIAVGAIKYVILRNEPVKDVEFSWDAALNFEGESGPYLQYSYARASSILRKAEKENKKAKSKASKKVEIPNLNKQEIELIKKIKSFPEIVKQAAEKLNPSLLAHYSYELSQIFNEFYHNTKVIGEKEEAFRLKLVNAFARTLKNALYLLGIEVMDEM
ncbi:arginine--tRNA ligase, partial [Candidatus Pacearchaeota archaeon]|nr:arginine--tRNA ligase [Candidatus Pacearchaeota archaeon]